MAVACRNEEALKVLGESNTPTSYHCRALRSIRLGALDEAEDLLSPLVAGAGSSLRARALVTKAAVHLIRADVGAAETSYRRASQLVSDPFTAIHLCKARAIVAAQRERHGEALAELERGFLLLDILPPNHPLRLDFFNSIAVELTELGCPNQARQIIAPAVHSSFAAVYPEWIETASDERLSHSSGLITVPASISRRPGLVLPFRHPGASAARAAELRMRASLVTVRSRDSLLHEAVVALGQADHERLTVCRDVATAPAASFELARRAVEETDVNAIQSALQYWDRSSKPRSIEKRGQVITLKSGKVNT